MRVKNIPLEQIKPPRLDPRLSLDEAAIEELAQSIKRHGLISPLTVTPDDGGYRLLAGRRRYLALKLIEAKSAPCVVVEAPDELQDEITIVENLLRQDLSPVEEAYALALYLNRFECTQQELAERLGKDRTWVTKRLALLDLDEHTLGAIEQGVITMSEALELRRVDDLEVRHKFIEHAAKYGCTVQLMRYWVAGYLKQKATLEAEEGRSPQAHEVEAPREVYMACDRCGKATSYTSLKAAYLCPECFRLMALQRLAQEGQK